MTHANEIVVHPANQSWVNHETVIYEIARLNWYCGTKITSYMYNLGQHRVYEIAL